jgi:hypothetical protein
MNGEAQYPANIEINAYTGKSVASGVIASTGKKWPLTTKPPERYRFLKPPAEPEWTDWNHPNVGWGLIAPMPLGFTTAQLRDNIDLPDCLRNLIAKRNDAPVFRYDSTWPQAFSHVHNLKDGSDISLGNSPSGIGSGCLPKYLLIWATPQEIPWEIQYAQQGSRFVGRVPLMEPELSNYVSALTEDWSDCECDPNSPVVWAVDHGHPDITHLMSSVVAKRVYADLAADQQIGAKASWLSGTGDATGARLIDRLSKSKPALVVTTSHGKTTLGSKAELARDLGVPVDQDHQPLDTVQLLHNWPPNGAVWYAHACCSAGSMEKSVFIDLVEPTSTIAKVLRAVSNLGSRVAPLPMRLLGHKRPARAFIGHVEPTFNWTLRHPSTGQIFTDGLRSALYNRLLRPSPVGYAMQRVYENLGTVRATYENIAAHFDGTDASRAEMLYHNLVAQDLRTMVLLGDPTATLPALK